MHERIKQIRKSLNLTQEEFARRIGMKQNTIATIESGRETSNQTIQLICREFDVNEKWLRTGEGEMFCRGESIIQSLADQRGLSANVVTAVEKFIKLPPDVQEAILGYIRDVAKNMVDNDS